MTDTKIEYDTLDHKFYVYVDLGQFEWFCVGEFNTLEQAEEFVSGS